MGINIAQILRPWSQRSPTRPAIVLRGQAELTLSYGELDARACRAAAYLRAQGLLPGTPVALSVPNGLGFLDAFWGALYAGLTLVPVPPMSAPPELAARLRHARCAALLTSESTRALGESALALLDPTQALPLHLDVEALAQHQDASDGPIDLPAGAVALMLYTSGTTGVAKGAQITHASLLAHTAALAHHALKLREDDVVLATLPLTHSYGIRMTLFAPCYTGARSVLVERFDAARCIELIAAHGVTWFPGVPTMFHALVHAPTTTSTSASTPWPSLRWCMSAGAPLAPDIRKRFEARFGVPLRQGFGLTEATFSTLGSPDDEAGADSVGKPVFGVEVRICDAEGKPLPHGMPGEICIRGQNVMAGYFEDEAATQAALHAGFLRTGDVGMLDDEGRLYVVDRIKDMVVRGGFNVYPAEVEAVLVSHPEVHQAVVVGSPDARYGEEVVALLLLEPGATLDVPELTRFCRAQLSATKIPRLWAAVTHIPQGPSGKLLRRAMRADVLDGKIPLVRAPR